MSAGPPKSPAFQLYARDWLSDVDELGLSLEQEGAYMRALCYAWLARGLSPDLEQIRESLKLTPSRFAKVWTKIGRMFAPGADGRLVNKRQEEERAKQRAHQEGAVDAGRRGAAMRWKRGRKPKAEDVVTPESPDITSEPAAEPKKPAAPVTTLMKRYHDGFKAKHGIAPHINGPKDGKLLKTLAKAHGEETVGECLDDFFTSQDPFILESSYGVGVFASQINRLLIARQQRQPQADGPCPRCGNPDGPCTLAQDCTRRMLERNRREKGLPPLEEDV